MLNKAHKFGLSGVAVAVMLSIGSTAAQAEDGADEENAIEEMVVTATRLKGSATAVLQERKQQAFVADILGAEQISRTGDGDAAAALRRVPGLTLVDGKFIYIRGLGERYSSTQLSGAMVPSPDPTRNVVPLDMFPADIIESLNVQKAYSASLPAHFGAGNVDIRLKTLPDQYIFKMSGSLGSNTDNFDDGIGYSGGDNDWLGKDDGTRGMPAQLAQLWDSRTYLNDDDVSDDLNREIALDLKRDYDVGDKSLGPNGSLNATIGNSWDSGDFRYGAMLNLGYSNGWKNASGLDVRQPSRNGEELRIIRGYDSIRATKHEVKWSSLLALGIDYKRNHRLDFTTMVLHDTEDMLRERIGVTANVNASDNAKVRDVDVIYQERQLIVNQLKGMHTFTDWNFFGIDWMYSDSKSSRYAPGNVESRYVIADRNLDGVYDLDSETSYIQASTAGRYSFQELDDGIENFKWNATLPVSQGKWEMEFKFGADFLEKIRRAKARRFDLDTRAFDGLDFNGNTVADILTDDVVANWELSRRILRDTTVDGDDYDAVQKIDAYYFEADFFFNEEWRINAGVRWEDFRQVVVGLTTEGQFDLDRPRTEEDWMSLVRKDDDYYPALSLTYITSPETQWRFSYSETTVRPDLREVANTTFLDPLTLDPIRGTSGLRSTQMTHYDVRWESFYEDGNSLAVSLFYKDMVDPIESIQSPAQDGPPLIVKANAETGEIYGMEFEFMQDLKFASDWGVGKFWQDMFASGNLTLSDSEIVIDTQKAGEQTGVSPAITNTTRRLTGHSEWVVNLQLGYDSPDGNHTATMVYNVFGPRITIPGIEDWNDLYEQPFHSLDLVYSYFPSYSSQIKVKLTNILNDERTDEFTDTLGQVAGDHVDFVSTKGVGFSLSYSKEF